jgi:hypothetical protein
MERFGAGEEVRTLDIQFGRLTLYQLSYTRIKLADQVGIEPTTCALTVRRNYQLCYWSIKNLAERIGFEPMIQVFAQMLS